MVKKITRVTFLLFGAVLIFYVVTPSPDFPQPPPDSAQSSEPGDTETFLRRAYFTSYTRQEVLVHYQNQFKGFFTYRLNYPPEEAQTLIRDQTRSTFLEEIVHPFRESLFVNGFEPTDPKDDVWYKGVDYRQKIIVRFVPSSIVVRLGVAFLTIISIWVVFQAWEKTARQIIKKLKNA